jgi:hypothetical protein
MLEYIIKKEKIQMPDKITYIEAVEMGLGDIPLDFTNYYKYSFVFNSRADCKYSIEITVGGDSGDIYRADVYPEMTLNTLDSEFGIEHVWVSERKGG